MPGMHNVNTAIYCVICALKRAYKKMVKSVTLQIYHKLFKAVQYFKTLSPLFPASNTHSSPVFLFIF